MITLFGEGRGFRVAWLLEEMGLPYRLRPVDLMAGVESDAEFLAVNPAGFIPALRDGDMIMVESIAIMEYLIARYGPAHRGGPPLAPAPTDSAYGAYQQFLHLGEAGLAMPIYFRVVTQNHAPEADRDNWTFREALEAFHSRLALVDRRLAEAPYMAGESFSAADISVTWALQFAQRTGNHTLDAGQRAYVARTTDRDGYRRAMETCEATRGWAARTEGAAAGADA